jgi:hypothetical protein
MVTLSGGMSGLTGTQRVFLCSFGFPPAICFAHRKSKRLKELQTKDNLPMWTISNIDRQKLVPEVQMQVL